MTAWQEWERGLDTAGGPREQPLGVGDPASQVGGKRRVRRRARRQAARTAQRAARRGYVQQLEGTPGVPVLIAALVVVAVVIWLRLQNNDSTGVSAVASDLTSDAPATSSPPVSVVLDPHAGSEVLPPRGMPPAPSSPGSHSAPANPVAAAEAFAAQACAALAEESTQEYRQRLAAFSTPQTAQSWTGGSAQRVHCMQIAGALISSDPAVPVVQVGAVQVYADPSDAEGMRAYRWSATLTLASSGQGWTVSG